MLNVMMLKTASDLKRRQLDDLSRGPEPINPFKKLRTQSGYSLAGLSKLAHIDEKALTRAEQGTYTQPLPSLVEYWIRRIPNLSTVDLNSDYEDYVTNQRNRHKFYFGRSLLVDVNDQHPFRQLRARRPSKHDNTVLPVGLVECSRALCVPLDTIQFFEKKLSQQSVPKPLKTALNQIGYTSDQLRQFEFSYTAWRDIQIHKVNGRFS